ncbi:MAG: hypothetical protein WB774_05995 [Xanthobacteraceae bacterium]|jgi:hypothetical protein
MIAADRYGYASARSSAIEICKNSLCLFEYGFDIAQECFACRRKNEPVWPAFEKIEFKLGFKFTDACRNGRDRLL